jgi:hypothetical protein
MTVSRSLIFGAALMLISGGAALAQTSSPSSSTKSSDTAKATVHEEMGTVGSLTGSQLVLEHMVKGKQEETTFKLDSSTKKEGAIDKGARVAVYFKDQNHERIATEIKAEPKKS